MAFGVVIVCFFSVLVYLLPLVFLGFFSASVRGWVEGTSKTMNYSLVHCET